MLHPKMEMSDEHLFRLHSCPLSRFLFLFESRQKTKPSNGLKSCIQVRAGQKNGLKRPENSYPPVLYHSPRNNIREGH